MPSSNFCMVTMWTNLVWAELQKIQTNTKVWNFWKICTMWKWRKFVLRLYWQYLVKSTLLLWNFLNWWFHALFLIRAIFSFLHTAVWPTLWKIHTFLPRRIYLKSTLKIQWVPKLPFMQFQRLIILFLGQFHPFKVAKHQQKSNFSTYT